MAVDLPPEDQQARNQPTPMTEEQLAWARQFSQGFQGAPAVGGQSTTVTGGVTTGQSDLDVAVNAQGEGQTVGTTGPYPLMPFEGYDPAHPDAIWFPGLNVPRVNDVWSAAPTVRGDYGIPWTSLEPGIPAIDPNYYVSGDQAKLWNSYSPETRAYLERRLIDAGLLAEGSYVPGSLGIEQHNAWSVVLSRANYNGSGPVAALNQLVDMYQRWQAAQAGRGGGGGGGGGISTAYVVPDYESIAQQSKDLFRQVFGNRDPEDWELSMVADYMQQQYRSAAETQMQARLAGNGEFEVPDPTLKTKSYIEDTWANELSRLQDIQSTTQTHNLLISAATGGARLMGSTQ